MRMMKSPAVRYVGIAMVWGCVISTNGWAQESETSISVKEYAQNLDEKFAYQYLNNEQFLIDLISVIRTEYKDRKGKGLLKSESTAKESGQTPSARDSIKARLKILAEQFKTIKKSNQFSEGMSGASGLNALHVEYEKLYATDYLLTKIDAMNVRSKLLTSGDNAGVRQLFDRQLKIAIRRFIDEDYRTAVLELTDVYETYKSYFTEWDDILYYIAQSYFRMQDFDNAEKYFFKTVTDFPTSAFVKRSLFKLIAISYVENDRTKMQKYFDEFAAKVPPDLNDDITYNQAFFLTGITEFKTSDFSAATATLGKIPNTSRYYYPAIYLIAHCYANQDAYTEALENLQTVIHLTANNKKFDLEVQRQLKDLSQLKSAWIKFEQTVNGQKFRALYPFLKSIPAAAEVHDASLLASAWSMFKDNNIDSARTYVDSMVRTYPSSDLLFEAKTLIGNIQVLDPNLSDKDRELQAVDAYNYVAGATEAKYLSDQYITERDSAANILDLLHEARNSAGLRNDTAAFRKYDNAYKKLDRSIDNNGFTRSNSKTTRSPGYYQTMSGLISEIRITQGQLKNAQEAKDEKQMDQLNKKMAGLLNQFQAVGGERFVESAYSGSDSNAVDLNDETASIETQNYFALNKVPRSISEIESRNRVLSVLKEKISREKEIIQTQLANVDQLMAAAKERNRPSITIKLEYEKNKLTDLYYRLSRYEILLFSSESVESYVDLDTWGDFASYGRNNITYVINTTKTETIKDVSRAVAQIDKILLARKKNYESRIISIEEEIKLKEQEIKDKELQEARSSQQQFFQKEYFQFKLTEKPENDPYDYKDLVPDVVVITDTMGMGKKPLDSLKTNAAPDSTGKAKTDSTAKAVSDTTQKSGSMELKKENEKAKDDKAKDEKAKDEKAKVIEEKTGGDTDKNKSDTVPDSTKKDGGGGMRGQLDILLKNAGTKTAAGTLCHEGHDACEHKLYFLKS